MEKLDTKLVDMREMFDEFKRGFNDPHYLVSSKKRRWHDQVISWYEIRIFFSYSVGNPKPIVRSVLRESRES